MKTRGEILDNLSLQGITLARQEINYKTNRNVFTFHKDNQDCFQVVNTKNDVYFKKDTNHNLSLETMKIIIEFMEYLLKDITTDKKVEV